MEPRLLLPIAMVYWKAKGILQGFFDKELEKHPHGGAEHAKRGDGYGHAR